ncbi:hypothetical protein [Hansschlegelia zhihuaiae]|nr:hypothetical protein [Hansschlegelia zhihuaiae]
MIGLIKAHPIAAASVALVVAAAAAVAIDLTLLEPATHFDPVMR